MKKQNLVLLRGTLTDCVLQTVDRNGLGETVVLVCRLHTDKPYFGGVHVVEFPARLAKEVLAFQAASRKPLEVSVEGWLKSFPGQSCSTVADTIMYHVDNATTARAREMIRSSLKRGNGND